jgi:FkbM family methyltransferase
MSRYIEPHRNQTPGLIDIYMKYFGYKSNGHFINVGANNGVWYDTCWPLVNAGWTGIQIEPDTSVVQELQDHMTPFENISILNCAVGNKNGESTFFVDPNARKNIGTLSVDYAKNITNTFNNQTTVQVRTLDNILEENSYYNKFDVLSIDVEGYEVEVLEGYTISKYQPKMVIIECNKHNSILAEREIYNSTRYNWIDKYFTDNNYVEIYESDINSIYVKE